MFEQSLAPFRVRARVPDAPRSSIASGSVPVRNVLTYGRFDGFTTGHALMLGQLARMGDLIVGCASDALCAATGQASRLPFEARRALLENCRHVARVIPLESWDQRLTDIVNYNVSVFAVRGGLGPECAELDQIVQVVHMPSEDTSLSIALLTKSA